MRVRFRSLDEIEGLQRMVKTIDVDLVAKSVAVFVRALEQRIFVRLHIVIAVKVGVGADADMVDADQLCDMVDMVGHMPDIGWIAGANRSEEQTSELQSLMRISYAVFCIKKKNNIKQQNIA